MQSQVINFSSYPDKNIKDKLGENKFNYVLKRLVIKVFNDGIERKYDYLKTYIIVDADCNYNNELIEIVRVIYKLTSIVLIVCKSNEAQVNTLNISGTLVVGVCSEKADENLINNYNLIRLKDKNMINEKNIYAINRINTTTGSVSGICEVIENVGAKYAIIDRPVIGYAPENRQIIYYLIEEYMRSSIIKELNMEEKHAIVPMGYWVSGYKGNKLYNRSKIIAAYNKLPDNSSTIDLKSIIKVMIKELIKTKHVMIKLKKRMINKISICINIITTNKNKHDNII